MFANHALMGQLKWAWLNIAHNLFGPDAGSYHVVRRLCLTYGVEVGTMLHAPPGAFETFVQLRAVPLEHRWCKELAVEWNFHPLTGVLALYHLHLTECAEIYVDGMTFYRTEHGKTPLRQGSHNIPPQKKCVSDLLARDSRIKASKDLEQSLLAVYHDPREPLPSGAVGEGERKDDFVVHTAVASDCVNCSDLPRARNRQV